jgi:hypothetical protein
MAVEAVSQVEVDGCGVSVELSLGDAEAGIRGSRLAGSYGGDAGGWEGRGDGIVSEHGGVLLLVMGGKIGCFGFGWAVAAIIASSGCCWWLLVVVGGLVLVDVLDTSIEEL